MCCDCLSEKRAKCARQTDRQTNTVPDGRRASGCRSVVTSVCARSPCYGVRMRHGLPGARREIIALSFHRDIPPRTLSDASIIDVATAVGSRRRRRRQPASKRRTLLQLQMRRCALRRVIILRNSTVLQVITRCDVCYRPELDIWVTF